MCKFGDGWFGLLGRSSSGSGKVSPASSKKRSGDEGVIPSSSTKSARFTDKAPAQSTRLELSFGGATSLRGRDKEKDRRSDSGKVFPTSSEKRSGDEGVKSPSTKSAAFTDETRPQSTKLEFSFTEGATSLRDRDKEKDQRYWVMISHLSPATTEFSTLAGSQIGYKQEETPSSPKPSFIDISPSDTNVSPSKRIEYSFGINLDMTPEERSRYDFAMSMRENFYKGKYFRSKDSKEADPRSTDLTRENDWVGKQVKDMEGNFDLYDIDIGDDDIDLEAEEWNTYLSPQPYCPSEEYIYERVLYEN